eukprot:s74_g24.t1
MLAAALWTPRPPVLLAPRVSPPERPRGPRRQRVVLGAAAAAAAAVSGARRYPKALEPTVQVLMTNLQVSEAYALRMSKDIRKFAVARDGDDATGSRSVAWAKKLCRGLEMHQGLEPLLRHVGGVEKVLLELEKRSRKHTQVFQDIAQQHEALREGEDIDMEDYSKAAEYMGHEWWVRASHQRIIDRIDQYYLLSADQMHRGHPPWVFCKNNRLPKGWREYTLQGRRMYWNPEKMRMQNQVPEGLSMAMAPEPVEPPVKLLDIGSSINRFKDWPFYVEAHAVDLQPAAEDVYQAEPRIIPWNAGASPVGCDTFVALPPAAPPNTVIFGKNSDRPNGEGQSVRRYPGGSFEPWKK